MTSGKALIFHCHFAGFTGTDSSLPCNLSTFSSGIIGLMRMKEKYNQPTSKNGMIMMTTEKENAVLIHQLRLSEIM